MNPKRKKKSVLKVKNVESVDVMHVDGCDIKFLFCKIYCSAYRK